jgi:hypothetical protein
VEAGLAMLYDVEKEEGVEKIIQWRPEKYVEGVLGDERAPERIARIIHEYMKGGASKGNPSKR